MCQRRRVLEVLGGWIRKRDGRFLFSVGELVFEIREGGRAHDFVFDEFIWAVYEFFHFRFPDCGVSLERCAGKPHREMLDWDGKGEFGQQKRKETDGLERYRRAISRLRLRYGLRGCLHILLRGSGRGRHLILLGGHRRRGG